MTTAKERSLCTQFEALLNKINARVETQNNAASENTNTLDHSPEAVRIQLAEIERLHAKAQSEIDAVSGMVSVGQQHHKTDPTPDQQGATKNPRRR